MTERDAGAPDGPEAPIEVVEERLAEIQARHRGRIRWRITHHTAELAIRALQDRGDGPAPRSSKSRRRKRKKRLL